jgi:hypothetical protein
VCWSVTSKVAFCTALSDSFGTWEQFFVRFDKDVSYAVVKLNTHTDRLYFTVEFAGEINRPCSVVELAVQADRLFPAGEFGV